MLIHSPAALRRMRLIEALCPRTADQLDRFLRLVLKMTVPRRAVVAVNDAPFDYIEAAFFRDRAGSERGGDLVVWASRGGGKTHLGAAATLLDMLFKPGIQVRILGGSMEQSRKMHEHLLRMLDTPALRATLASEPTRRRLELVNGSAVELLSQSQRSVRGTRVHKLRCDEVEEFDEEVWSAAQMVTRSGDCGGVPVRGTIEAISTMHLPFGLMSKLVARAGTSHGNAGGGEDSGVSAVSWGSGGARVLRWCALDVIERCPPARPCAGCRLWDDCGGRAKEADGFVPVEDLLSQRWRSSDAAWESEMMCRRPTVTHSVYPTFTPARHVADTAPGGGRTELVAAMRRELPLWSAPTPINRLYEEVEADPDSFAWVAGMDFGLRSPLVMLWGRVCESVGTAPSDRVLEIVDEYIDSGLLVEQHLERIESRGWPKPAWLAVDPAGGQRNSQTGLSDIQLLRRRGYKVRTRSSTIAAGVELIRRRLDRGLLRVDPRCESLVRGLTEYHFDPRRVNDPNPVKDGPDHVCDALRYLVINLDVERSFSARSYA